MSEQGPTHGRYDHTGPNVTDFTAPVNSHIQGISVQFGANCGEPNAAVYGECIVCGRSYEQIRETAVLTYLESTSRRNESYQERQRRRNAYFEGMNQGTVLLVPKGVSQAAACDGNYYQIPQEPSRSTPYLKTSTQNTLKIQLVFISLLLFYVFSIKDLRSTRPQYNSNICIIV